jgi:hypothetical protein
MVLENNTRGDKELGLFKDRGKSCDVELWRFGN